MLARLERSLAEAGVKPVRFLIVGDGSERFWLAANMKHAELSGILKGVPVAEAYANMDVFVFHPKQIHSETSFWRRWLRACLRWSVVWADPSSWSAMARRNIAGKELDFVKSVLLLYRHREVRGSMRENSRRLACQRSWDAVFPSTYDRYADAMANGKLFASGRTESAQVACAAP